MEGFKVVLEVGDQTGGVSVCQPSMAGPNILTPTEFPLLHSDRGPQAFGGVANRSTRHTGGRMDYFGVLVAVGVVDRQWARGSRPLGHV